MESQQYIVKLTDPKLTKEQRELLSSMNCQVVYEGDLHTAIINVTPSLLDNPDANKKMLEKLSDNIANKVSKLDFVHNVYSSPVRNLTEVKVRCKDAADADKVTKNVISRNTIAIGNPRGRELLNSIIKGKK